jgi:hypothetical protein
MFSLVFWIQQDDILSYYLLLLFLLKWNRYLNKSHFSERIIETELTQKKPRDKPVLILITEKISYRKSLLAGFFFMKNTLLT